MYSHTFIWSVIALSVALLGWWLPTVLIALGVVK